MGRKRGGQPGNKNAVGNSGGGAPLGNQNALQHGGYSAVLPETLTDEEIAMLNEMPLDPQTLLMDEIKLLTVRERRIMQRIRSLEAQRQVLRSVVRYEEKREFSSQRERDEYERIVREKVEHGKRLPGRPYHLTSTSEASSILIYQLETALTHCQEQKRRCIDSFIKIRGLDTTLPVVELVGDWINAVFAADQESANGDGE